MRNLWFLFIFILYSIFSFSKDISFKFNVPVGKIEYFKMNDLNTQSQDFYDSTVTLKLDKTEYYFLFTSENYSSIQKVIDVDKVTQPLEINFYKNETSIVKGKVKSDDSVLGDVQLYFTDAKNHTFNFSTNIYGEYVAYLPPGNYKVSIRKSGYISKDNEEIIYDFSYKAIPYVLNFSLEELPSFIQGHIIDENGLAIPFPEVSIKSGNNITKVIGDNEGIFKLPVKSGIISILGQKKGFLQNGVVKKIDRNVFINNIEIQLTRARYSITGTVLNDTQALKNIKLELVGEDFNKIASTVSSENGFFEFYKISGEQKVFILVFKDNKIIKKSELINLNQDINNFNILIK